MNHNSPDSQKFSSIENLRAFHDQRFIRLAYRTILGREPESTILENYCHTENPHQELENIRNSDEANQWGRTPLILYGCWGMTDSSSVYKSSLREGWSQTPEAGIENLKSSESRESDPIDFVKTNVIGVDCWALRLNGGGARYVFESLLERFSKSTYRFILFLHPEAYACIEQLQMRTGIFRNVIRIKISDPSLIYKYEKFIDLLYCPFNNISVRLFSKPVVAVLHDVQEKFLPEMFSKEDLMSRNEHYGDLLRSADTVITISDFCKESFVEKYNADASKIKVVFNAAQSSLTNIAKNSSQINSVINPSKFSKSGYILYPANFYLHKNHAALIHAYELANTKGIKLPALVFVGNPSSANGNSALFRKINSQSERIEILTDISPEQLARLYFDCTFVVIPTLFEGFCLPAVEAMAFGKLLICSELPILKEVTRGEAIFFNPNDTESIEAAMISGLNYIDSASARDARIRASNRFDWQTSAENTLNIFEETIRNYYICNEINIKSIQNFQIIIIYKGEPLEWLQRTIESIKNTKCRPKHLQIYIINFTSLQIDSTILKCSEKLQISKINGEKVDPSSFLLLLDEKARIAIFFAGSEIKENYFIYVCREYDPIVIGEVEVVHEDQERSFERENYFKIVDGIKTLDKTLFPEMIVFREAVEINWKLDWPAVWSLKTVVSVYIAKQCAKIIRRKFASVLYRSTIHQREDAEKLPALQFNPDLNYKIYSARKQSMESNNNFLKYVSKDIAPKLGCHNPPLVCTALFQEVIKNE